MEGLFEGLGINLPLLIAFVVNFVILFGLLSIILYKPVLKMLDERQAKITESIEQAEQIKQQTAHAEEEIREHLDSARKEGQKIVAQAEEIGTRLKNEARDEARKEAESLIAKAKVEMQIQRDKDINELREQFADIAISAAEKVINTSLDKKKHQKLIEETLDKSSLFKQN
ncbi:F0F1 ATP synthase subunit B [Chloroflexota bacterium]